MSFEKVLSWVVVLGGGLSPMLVAFVVLLIGRSRSRKRDYGTLASGSVDSNKAFLEQSLAAPRTIQPDELTQSGKTATVERMQDKRVLSVRRTSWSSTGSKATRR